MIGIYKITNSINGHSYIGQSKHIEKRWKEHSFNSRIMLKDTLIRKAFLKYGKENFNFEVLEICSIEDLDKREIYWINELKPEYNMTSGGNGAHNLQKESIEKMSIASKKQWESKTEEEKMMFIKSNLKGPGIGHKVSAETIEKLRNANLGKKQSESACMKHKLSAIQHGFGGITHKHSVVGICEDRSFAYEFPTIKSAARYFLVHESSIIGVLKGKRKHCRNLKWFYGSVETNRDECSGVGVILSHAEVQGIHVAVDEEIVRSDEMVNLRENDKAFLQFAARGGECERINVTDVKEGELKARDRRTGDITLEFIADDTARAKAKTIGYLGYVRLRNGYEKEVYWSVEELTQHGLNYSQTFKKGYGVWKDNFDAMAKKTVLKLMLNKGDIPMSVEMAQLARYDQSVILDENGSARYIDNEKRSADEQAADFAGNVEEAKVEEAQVEEVK